MAAAVNSAERTARETLLAHGYGDQFSSLDRIRAVLSGSTLAGHRPADQDDMVAALTLVTDARNEVDLLEAQLIGALRGAGASWAELGEAMGGITAQGAQQRAVRLGVSGQIGGTS